MIRVSLLLLSSWIVILIGWPAAAERARAVEGIRPGERLVLCTHHLGCRKV